MGSLDTILTLSPVSFDWRANDPAVLAHYPLIGRFASSTHSIGFIAQDVMPVLPKALSLETVGDAEVQYYQLDYAQFIPHLIGAVKDLAAKVSETAHLALGAVTARIGTFGRVETDELCARTSTSTFACVTGDQLTTLLSQSAAAPPTSSVSPLPSEISEPLAQNPEQDNAPNLTDFEAAIPYDLTNIELATTTEPAANISKSTPEESVVDVDDEAPVDDTADAPVE